jgi:hypothetical protein
LAKDGRRGEGAAQDDEEFERCEFSFHNAGFRLGMIVKLSIFTFLQTWTLRHFA